MSAPFESAIDSQGIAESGLSDSTSDVRDSLNGVAVGARANVVNRTHRVVRERARVIAERRHHVRSLLLPLTVCSALLILLGVAVWSGLDQSETVAAARAIPAEVSSPTGPDSSSQFLLLLLWFVPLSVALLATMWSRRSRRNTNQEAH
jgi:hypothetical protein